MPARPSDRRWLSVAPEVEAALLAGRPVVGLESAVITHGLPREAAIRAAERQGSACTAGGGLPAIVAVFEGKLRIGLSLDECARLADSEPIKVSLWNLSAALASPGYGGTTVAATVLAAALVGIKVVSTGGLGGVHPGSLRDESADLPELARRRVCVVCAGPKSILDAAATLERLETLGVPVIGWRSSELAGFLSQSAHLPLSARVESLPELASLLVRHWELGGAGAVVSQPLPIRLALPEADLRPALRRLPGKIGGAGRTPAQLARLRERIGERAVEANLALLERNAELAGQLAKELAQLA